MMKPIYPRTLVVLALLLSSCVRTQADGDSPPAAAAQPKQQRQPGATPAHVETATLGGGCFWCVEAVYEDLRGVVSVTSGYAGGTVSNPSYEQVCSGTTGHAEVVQITFDPTQLSYHDLLEVFFSVHDPTTLNRQGNDAGTQYRSVIFTHDDKQKQMAEQVKKEVAGQWKNPIVTEIAPYTQFFAAEDYHQKYYETNPYQPYCQLVISPKVKKFRKQYHDKLK